MLLLFFKCVVSEHSRMILNSSMYHSETYKSAGKTNNTVVKISAGGNTSEFVKLKNVLYTLSTMISIASYYVGNSWLQCKPNQQITCRSILKNGV